MSPSLCDTNRLLGGLGQQGEAIQVPVFGGFHSSWWLAGVGRVVAVASGSRSMWVPSSVEDTESAALALRVFTAHIVDLV